MKGVKIIIIIAGIFLAFAAYAGQNTDRIFADAGMFYQNDEIDNAIELYESILSSGGKTAELFYNLGNAYLKKGIIGKAILNYERAKIETPRDSALIFNLNYAKGKMKQQDLLFQTNILNDFLIISAGSVSLKANVIFAFSSFSLFLVLFILGLYARNIRWFIRLLGLMFFIVAVLASIPAYYKYYNVNNAAIIVEQLTDARYEPVEGSDPHFPLYEGNKVYILRETADWFKVKRPDGKIGWITKKTAVRLIA